jgi:methylaspartate mutase sigma subunit
MGGERGPGGGGTGAGPTVVTGVLNDIHHYGLKVLEVALRQAGFHVVSVGALVTQEELIRAAIETAARAILVSSASGHALLDCEGLRPKCVEAGLGDIVLYVGGNLVVTQQAGTWEEVARRFRDLGFTRAYPSKVHPRQVVADLRQDLGWSAGEPGAGGRRGVGTHGAEERAVG